MKYVNYPDLHLRDYCHFLMLDFLLKNNILRRNH